MVTVAPAEMIAADRRGRAEPSRATQTLAVEVSGIRYRSPDGEFAVVDALARDGEVAGEAERVVLTGSIAYLHEGEELRVHGSWREHRKHGLRFEVHTAEHAEPTSEGGLLAALGAIKYVGPRGADFLYERYGVEALAVVDRAPRARLREVPGIGRMRIDAALRSWEEQRGQRALRMFLGSCGVEAAVASRIYRAWGTESVGALRADPFCITRLPGIGFHTADRLAAALGVASAAPERIDAGLLHVLERAEADGHCFLPRPELERRAALLLAREEEAGDLDPDVLCERIRALAREGQLASERSPEWEQEETELVYTAEMHGVEQRLANDVRVLLDDAPALDGPRARRASSGGFTPTDEQWRAVERAFAHRVSILTGGPGTGKTTSMRVLVHAVQASGASVRLCAPTGKAARRLAAATGRDASTIHQLLGWVPGSGFARDRENRLEGVDMLIVDEVSMLSVRLAEALFAAVGERTHVLLVGDTDQLAAVGPGRVLEDLIASESVPVTALSEVFRQAQRSLIVRAAHDINHGRRPAQRETHDDDVRDFFLIEREREERIFAEVVSLACERMASHFGLDPRIDIQVLSPMRRGAVGIEALNAELRGRLNPDGAQVPCSALRLGDRVIQTRNDHEHGFMNGEVALAEHWDGDRERLALRGDDGRVLSLPLSALDSVEPAYAISIHKAQGSQAPAIVLVLARSQRIMLTRNLVYTGITRAERVCVVVAQPGALELALARRDARRRNTRLAGLVSAQSI